MGDRWGRTIVTVPDAPSLAPTRAVGEKRVSVERDPVTGKEATVSVQTIEVVAPLAPLKPCRKRVKLTVAQLRDKARAEQARREELIAEERERAEKRMGFAASEKRLGKEVRAYAKLDEINERWARGRK